MLPRGSWGSSKRELVSTVHYKLILRPIVWPIGPDKSLALTGNEAAAICDSAPASSSGITRHPEGILGSQASSRRVQTGCPAWTTAGAPHGSLGNQSASAGSINGPTGWQKFETC